MFICNWFQCSVSHHCPSTFLGCCDCLRTSEDDAQGPKPFEYAIEKKHIWDESCEFQPEVGAKNNLSLSTFSFSMFWFESSLCVGSQVCGDILPTIAS